VPGGGQDRSLTTLAASRIARRANRIHSISFNTSAVREPDYLICYQCGFILRLFGIPAADRVDLAGTTEGSQVVQRLLTAPDGPGKKLRGLKGPDLLLLLLVAISRGRIHAKYWFSDRPSLLKAGLTDGTFL
jgi:hypothetical protein